MNKSVTTTVEIIKLDKLKMHALLLPDAVLIQLNEGEEKGKYNQRAIINIQDKVEWQGGVVVLGVGYGYITLSQARMKVLDVLEGDKVTITLTKDDSKYGHQFPKELEAVLNQDELAKKRFEGLTPGKQRTIIYYINQPKSEEKRIERSILYMNNLKTAPIGQETMRHLMGKE